MIQIVLGLMMIAAVILTVANVVATRRQTRNHDGPMRVETAAMTDFPPAVADLSGAMRKPKPAS